MATVKKIVPCVCSETPSEANWYEKSVYYGMPQLKVSDGMIEHRQFWSAFCPSCGRGGCGEDRSPYLALKRWNEMQIQLWRFERDIDIE